MMNIARHVVYMSMRTSIEHCIHERPAHTYSGSYFVYVLRIVVYPQFAFLFFIFIICKCKCVLRPHSVLLYSTARCVIPHIVNDI